jgi:hypothetical protein
MKRLLLFAAISISVSAFAQHPTDKGWRSVGGTGNLHFDLDNSDGTNNYFQLGPEVYWFVGNSFGLGTDFGFSMMNSKFEDTAQINKNQNISFWVTPGFRFYMRDPEKSWRPYFFANVGFQYSGYHSSTEYKTGSLPDVSGSSSTKGLRGYTGAGLAWFFSDHAAFDIRCKVLDLYPGSNSAGDPEMQFGYSPDFTIGVQAFFD